jgi:hypothetical protein
VPQFSLSFPNLETLSLILSNLNLSNFGRFAIPQGTVARAFANGILRFVCDFVLMEN